MQIISAFIGKYTQVKNLAMTCGAHSVASVCAISKGMATCAIIFLAVSAIAERPAAAKTYFATPSNYLSFVHLLRPGDTLALSPGTYRDGLPLHNLNGTPEHPIVVRGNRDATTTMVARPDANTVSIVNSSYVEVRDLVLDGDGQIADGVKAEGHSLWAHHITLDGLTIVRHGADQQIVGISTQCPAWGWVIRNNTIIGAGTGMYLGRSDGGGPFISGVIEHNLIMDTIGYNLQIKQQDVRPKIQGIPEGKNLTIIRHNVFSKSANSSGGGMARPNLLVGHWPPSGSGAEDSYAIYGNFFYQNPVEALFQGEGNFAFYSNVLVNTSGDAINIQRQYAVPRRIEVFHNTVLAARTGIRVRGGDSAYAQRLIANAVFASVPIVGGDQQANITGLVTEAAQYLVEPFAPLGRLDLSPRSGRLFLKSFEFLPQLLAPDWKVDFEGRMYEPPTAGAYSVGLAARRLMVALKRRLEFRDLASPGAR